MARIGVLALQGAFARHADVVRTLGHQAILIRAEADFAGLEGLILPGGESGVLGSPFYASQLGRWLTNNYKTVNIKVSDAVANPIQTLNFVP